MALRAGYWGIKKLLSPLKLFKPGELGIDQDALNTELNTVFFPRSEQAVLGAKNLLNAPASVTVETSNTGFTELGKATLKAGQICTFSCVQETVLTSNTRNTLVVSKLGMSPSIIESDTQNYHLSSGLHKITFTAPSDGEYTFNVWCHTPSVECTYSQFQNELGSVETPIYAPYAMTNKELTDAISNISAGWDYSTNLTDTGKKWVDGKTIKAIVLDFHASPVTVKYDTWSSILDNASTVLGVLPQTIISCIAIGSSNSCTPCICYYDSANDKINALTPRNGANADGAYVILEFTEAQSNRTVVPGEAPATNSTKKSTKKTASADTNE